MHKIDMDTPRSNRLRCMQASTHMQSNSNFAPNSIPPYGSASMNGAAYRLVSPYNYAPIPPVNGGASLQTYPQSTHSDGNCAHSSDRVPYDRARIDFEENWGDNTTAITGATSETGASMMNDEFAAFAANPSIRSNAQFIDSLRNKEHLPVEYSTDAVTDVGCDCAHTLSLGASFVLAALSLISPVAMVVLPKCGLGGWHATNTSGSAVSSEAPLISFASKLLLLAIGSWALFVRKSRCSLPRLRIFRSLIGFLLLLLTLAFWLYYAFRIIERRESDFGAILGFASSFVDVLILVHYLAVVLIEVRAISNQFAIKVVRSPDGAARIYPIGGLSIQHAAVYVLDKYSLDFEQHNPMIDAAIRRHAMLNAGGSSASRAARRAQSASRRGGAVEYKFYEIEGVSSAAPTNVNAIGQNGIDQRHLLTTFDTNANGNVANEPASFMPASSLHQSALTSGLGIGSQIATNRKHVQATDSQSAVSAHTNTNTNINSNPNGASSEANGAQPVTPSGRYRRRMDREMQRNERFYAELEYERRLRRRRARLVSSVEDAFAHVHKISTEQSVLAAPLEPADAAQAVFPSIARPLQKYLRITRQQLKYSMDTIVAHLTLCLTYELGPRVFLERFLTQGAVLQNSCRVVAAAGNIDRSSSARQTWTILTDTSVLNRAVTDGSVFILKQHDVTLLCTVHKLPFFTLSEEFLDVKANKFVLKLNSETPV